MQTLWRKTSRHRLVIVFSVMAAAAYCVPLQKYVTLGRYQHYGMAIGIFGLGYLLQTIWSWKDFTHWARMAYLSTSLFSLAVGLTFFYNPWLDTKMALQTRANEQMRPVLMALYLLFSLYVGAVYARWIREENKSRTVPTGASSAALNNASNSTTNSASDQAADRVSSSGSGAGSTDQSDSVPIAPQGANGSSIVSTNTSGGNVTGVPKAEKGSQ